ncbi:unnamed protein product [Camellia sinensis]
MFSLLHPFFLALLPLFFFTLLILKWLSTTPKQNKNLPPSPSKLPIIGNLHQMGQFPHRSLLSLSQKHGPFMLLQFGSMPVLVVSSAKAAQEIMKTHDLTFFDRPKLSITSKLSYEARDVAFVRYREYWRQMRSLCVLQLLINKRSKVFLRCEGRRNNPYDREDQTIMFFIFNNGEFEQNDISAAGIDTTYSALEWVFAEPLKHPKVLRELQNQVRRIGNDKQYIIPRRSTRDVKLMGYDIAAGTRVITSAWAIGRDPLSWDEPEEFRPERFLNTSIDFKGHDFELIPFGAGRRGCPGIQFATAVDELALAKPVYKFDFAVPNGARGEDLDMSEAIGLTVHKRSPMLAVVTPCFF